MNYNSTYQNQLSTKAAVNNTAKSEMSNPLKQPCTIEVVSIVLQLTAIVTLFSTAVFCTKGAMLLCFLLQRVSWIEVG